MTNASNDLNKETIEAIKTDLLERKSQILKDLKSLANDDDKNSLDNNDLKPSFPEYGDKNDENAQEINEYSTNLATEQVLEKTLRDIDNALKRIEDKSYGICKYCKKPIGAKRLQARPVASACVECKTKLQNG